MNTPYLRRWNVGFVAMRCRHPAPAPPLSWRDFAEVGTPVSIAIGSSLLAAFALVYLLELLLPRRE